MTTRLLTFLLALTVAIPASVTAQVAARADYLIGPRDLIAVQVFGASRGHYYDPFFRSWRPRW